MQTAAAHFNPRKRRRSDQYPSKLEGGGACQPVSKKPRAVYPSDLQQPAAFWDNLSEIPLTRRALRELNRRNAQAARATTTSWRIGRSATRRTVAERERYHPPLKPATSFLADRGHNTYSELKSFSRHGGPNLLNLRGFRRPVDPINDPMASSQDNSTSRSRSRRSTGTKPTANTTTTKNTSPYDRAFQQHLIDHGIFPHGYEYPDGSFPPEPENMEEISQRLRQPRPSLSPSKFSNEQHKKFVRADVNAVKENQVKRKVIPIIEGEIKDPKTSSGEIPFTNLTPITDENLVPGNPDFYHGARPEQLRRSVRDELNGLIVPSTQHDLPIIPNHFTAAKGPDGSLAVAGRQASYDAALGARSIHALQSYGQKEPLFDGKAYAITSIYHGGQLKLFTSHPTKPPTPGARPEYHMNQIRSFSMTDTPETWRQGATAYRNSIDWAKEQRDDAIRRAHDVVNRITVDSSASNVSNTSFVSTVVTEASQEEEADTLESQVETPRSVSSEDFHTATSSHEAENEPKSSRSVPAKRHHRPRRQTDPRRKRQNQAYSEDEGTPCVPSLRPQIHQRATEGTRRNAST